MQNDASSAKTPPSPNEGKWILVVDDEPSMRMLIGMILQSQGWATQVAEGSEEAMAAIRAAALPPSLVICDVLMPGIDGLELVRRMCARIAGLNVLFISGHLTDVSWWPADLRDHRFLAKPFDNAQLIAVVREALSDAGAAI
jgi:two-component system, cell cycle sensor histidine kinase and response regulator CckA